jgi:uncharacterized membrane protein YidH (DUF202 family)
MVKAIGVLLIVLGIAGLAYGGFSWTQKEKVVDVGPVEVTRDKTESVAFPPIAGGALLVVGVVLLLKRA